MVLPDNFIESLKDYQKQFDYQSKALEIRRSSFGDDHPNTASTYNNVGNAYSRLGDYHSAIDFTKKALITREGLLGNTHPDTLIPVHNLIRYYVNNPRKDIAIKMREEALNLVNKYLNRIPNSNDEHKKLLEAKE